MASFIHDSKILYEYSESPINPVADMLAKFGLSLLPHQHSVWIIYRCIQTEPKGPASLDTYDPIT